MLQNEFGTTQTPPWWYYGMDEMKNVHETFAQYCTWLFVNRVNAPVSSWHIGFLLVLSDIQQLCESFRRSVMPTFFFFLHVIKSPWSEVESWQRCGTNPWKWHQHYRHWSNRGQIVSPFYLCLYEQLSITVAYTMILLNATWQWICDCKIFHASTVVGLPCNWESFRMFWY